MIRALMLIFILRPIIDLFWNIKVGPLNLAGAVAMIISLILYIIFIPALQRKKVLFNKITMFLVCYCTLITIFTFSNINELDNLFRIISSTIFLFVVSKNINDKQLETMLKWFIIVTLIPIIISYLQALGLVEYTYWDVLDSNWVGRASGGYRQPSVLTRFLTFSNLYCLYFISKYRMRRKVKQWCSIYLLLSCFSIFLSYHRTAYLINSAVICGWFIIENRKNLVRLIISFVTICISLIILITIAQSLNLVSISFEQLAKLVSIDNIFIVDNGKIQLVLRGRATIINQLKYYLNNSPWYYSILGNGVDLNNVTGFSMRVADMDWIRMIWNYGIIGLSIWGIQILNFFKIVKNSFACFKDIYLIRVGAFLIIIYIIFGFTIEATASPNFMYHIYLIIGYLSSKQIKENIYNKRRIVNEK